jgi:pimeloyl-ACP methyl ester carboxylesterase
VREEQVSIDGCTLAASAAGDPSRPAVLLLHGWPHDRSLYDPVIDLLGEQFYVLAFDLPDIGDSKCTPPSAEKAALADILVSAAERAGAHSPILAGIDVGGMIAFAAARDHGPRICGAIIGNTVIPGIDPWKAIISDPRIWHFAFHAVPSLPELLIRGHERPYFDFFFDFLGNKDRPLPDGVRDRFARAYQRPEALKAGFDWYRAFAADAKRNATPTPIDTPILYFRGDADGRKPDEYVAGLRKTGAHKLKGDTLVGTAEFTPIEAPERFASMVTEFAEQCFAEDSVSA